MVENNSKDKKDIGELRFYKANTVLNYMLKTGLISEKEQKKALIHCGKKWIISQPILSGYSEWISL